jgi:hypothetical protein
VDSLKKLSPAEVRRQEQLKRMQFRFRDMLDQLDKNQIDEIFNFGLGLGLFAKVGRIHFGYEHKGHTYVVTRWKTAPIRMDDLVS